jgi:hypothetical protein
MISPVDQLDTFRLHGKLPLWTYYKWRIPDKELRAAEKAMAKLPNILPPHAVIQLVPYLPPSGDMNGIRRTFHDLWALARTRYPEYYCDQLLSYDDFAGLKLLDGIKHEPGLRWEVIDLQANLDADPLAVRNKRSPHAGIMAIAAFQPEAIKKVPYRILLAGYDSRSVLDHDFTDPRDHSEETERERKQAKGVIPCLTFDRDDPGLNLTGFPACICQDTKLKVSNKTSWVIPAFV